MKYKPYTLKNFHKIKQLKYLGKKAAAEIEVVGRILPFKTNNYVIDELIDWSNYENDPLFFITFPHKKLIERKQFDLISGLLKSSDDNSEINRAGAHFKKVGQTLFVTVEEKTNSFNVFHRPAL